MRRSNLSGAIEIVAVVAFLAMTLVTWFTLERQSDKGTLLPSNLTAALLVGTLVPAMTILVMLGRRMALRRATESIGGGTGRMHVRLVFIFSLISAVPTLLVAIFASFLFQSGVEFWFSDSSRGLLENANKLARGYYEQTERDVGYESVAMAEDLNTFLSQETLASPRFAEFYSYQVVNRKLTESAILQRGEDGELLTAAIVDPEGQSGHDAIRPQVFAQLDAGEPLVVEADANKIEAVIPIDRRSGVYLYTARSSDLLAFSQGQRAENIVQAYQILTSRAQILQLRFNVALFVASLALVGLSVWFALRFADRQVKPLYDLVDAARLVGSGNFGMRVTGRTGADEIGLLNRAFNRMAARIETQTSDLVDANQMLQERRAFIEAVLESVTAGVISVSGDGQVLLMNSTAQSLLLGRAAPGPVDRNFAELAPQIAQMLENGVAQGIVQSSNSGELRTLAVKISRDATGHVITFEDITRQLIDQRQAAWSDVARRIAHEIKNPLTPIQLATERLRRRYRDQVEDNPELFESLTSTIIRQVGELRTMVDEFSSFARLPKPVFRGEDPVALARQALFLQDVAHPQVEFVFAADADIPVIACDRHQFGQAMTNVLKNAVEAIEARQREEAESFAGRVSLKMENDGDHVCVKVTDNGVGLPENREAIVEPYVTSREKGTGLGLAIVNKIVEEHAGDMTFSSRAEGRGTVVVLRFACDPEAEPRGAEAAE